MNSSLRRPRVEPHAWRRVTLKLSDRRGVNYWGHVRQVNRTRQRGQLPPLKVVRLERIVSRCGPLAESLLHDE